MIASGNRWSFRLSDLAFSASSYQPPRTQAYVGEVPFTLTRTHNSAQVCHVYYFLTNRKRNRTIKLHNANIVALTAKKANLSATRTERIKLPVYDNDSEAQTYHISAFLSQPSGIEAILNTRALQDFQFLDANTYRCKLSKVRLLNFEVTPVLDLRVIPTREDCMVELLSCKFEGSKVIESQNDHFSARMTNHIKWDTNISEPFLEVDVKLNLCLEIYTKPFTSLPLSAVERPGNLIIQALVDRLVPLLLQQLLQDYDKWVHQQCETL